MKISVTRKKSKNFIFDKWRWRLWIGTSRYPEYEGTAFTRLRAVKKAMKHIPFGATIVETTND